MCAKYCCEARLVALKSAEAESPLPRDEPAHSMGSGVGGNGNIGGGEMVPSTFSQPSQPSQPSPQSRSDAIEESIMAYRQARRGRAACVHSVDACSEWRVWWAMSG